MSRSPLDYILDIDIDFVLTYQAEKRPDRQQHRDSKWIRPPELFNRLVTAGLSNPSAVSLVGEHSEAFDVIQRICRPLRLIHLDAHGDLYDSGAPAKELLQYGYKPHEGNFLRYCLELELVAEINLVPPPWFATSEFYDAEVPERYRSDPRVRVVPFDGVVLPGGSPLIIIAASPLYTPLSCEEDAHQLCSLFSEMAMEAHQQQRWWQGTE